MSEILGNYKKWKSVLIPLTDEYYDLVLSNDTSSSKGYGPYLHTDCLSAYIDINKDECVNTKDNIFSSLSEYSYKEKTDDVAPEITLEDIGLTGIDTSLIRFDKTRISNKEFFDILTKSTLKIDANDTRLHLRPVDGNTGTVKYPLALVDDEKGRYLALKGGFLQGFYKLHGFDYEVLPQYIQDTWNMEFVIRPRDYTYDATTLNGHNNSENNGIFFYMGTRAENKFAQFIEDLSTSYSSDGDKIECCDTFYSGDYLDEKDNDYVSEEYFEQDQEIIDEVVTTSNGKPLFENGYFEFETDNKFLFFHRGEGGFTVDTWSDDATVIMSGVTREYADNPFLILHRGKDGKTVDTLGDETMYAPKKYDIMGDIKNNSFALKCNADGSIGYKYLIKDCDNENGWSIKEEYSYPGIIPNEEWSVINVMFSILGGNTDKCGRPLGERQMKIYIYVNGYLKFISKPLPEFDFRALNDIPEKQEGVPFNISLGGGTQGLKETIWLHYTDIFDKILPLEQHFAGSFIGDIRSFKFYTCKMNYENIKSNYLWEQKNNI